MNLQKSFILILVALLLITLQSKSVALAGIHESISGNGSVQHKLIANDLVNYGNQIQLSAEITSQAIDFKNESKKMQQTKFATADSSDLTLCKTKGKQLNDYSFSSIPFYISYCTIMI